MDPKAEVSLASEGAIDHTEESLSGVLDIQTRVSSNCLELGLMVGTTIPVPTRGQSACMAEIALNGAQSHHGGIG